MKTPFNIPFTTGKELYYIQEAIESGHLSGNGPFTRKCQTFFEKRYGFKKAFLTTSCTDALEMIALLIDIKPGDEVIVPSYTFVSTALAFARQGAVIRFVDSRSDHPGMDETLIEPLINNRTRAIVPVHYAGVACNMDLIVDIASKHDLFVIEDAAHAISSYYKDRPLGSIGHFACFSFHETKSIHCGEGGMLVVNDEEFIKRAEIVWEKGTNRAEFFRGETNRYVWKDIGSSFLSSEISAAFLYAQIEQIDEIQKRRLIIWNKYFSELKELEDSGYIQLPFLPDYVSNNAHIFYLLCKSMKERDRLISHLIKDGIQSVFHYLPLHLSDYYLKSNSLIQLSFSMKYADTLIRVPLYNNLTDGDIEKVTNQIKLFFEAE